MTLINRLRAAASAHTVRQLREDLFDLIGDGCENADDTFGAAVDCDGEDYSAIATSTIAGSLCEASFQPRNGSAAAQVRTWFHANGLSF